MLSNALRLSAIPNQVCNAVINGQSFVIAVRQIGSGLFTSVNVDGTQVTQNVRATAGGCLTPWPHASVGTKLYWLDQQGSEPPQYEGLGDRWVIAYE